MNRKFILTLVNYITDSIKCELKKLIQLLKNKWKTLILFFVYFKLLEGDDSYKIA